MRTSAAGRAGGGRSPLLRSPHGHGPMIRTGDLPRSPGPARSARHLPPWIQRRARPSRTICCAARSRSRRRSTPARGGRCRPTGPPTAETNVPALTGQFPQHAADGVLGARGHLTAARTRERFFASQVTAGGPIWPRGTPRPCRSSSSQIPENCVNAAISWIPASGRSRTRTWDLFLIRKTICPLQSSQLALNPCKPTRRRRRKGTGGDWRGQPGGPVVAPRPPFEGMVSYGPEADIMPTIRSSPDAPEAARCAPA